MAEFAGPTDVETAYEGSSPLNPDKIQFHLDIVSARLRILLPSLQARVDADEDIAFLVRDIVVQAVIRRMTPGTSGPQVSSETQTAGPFATTVRYSVDRSHTFSDDDLTMLRLALSGSVAGAGVGTIKTGRPDWYDQ